MATTSVTTSVSGGSITNGNTDVVVAGGSITSVTVSSSGSLVVSGGTDSGATVSAGGTETISSGSASGDLIYGTATVTGTNATVTNESVFNGGVVDLFKGAATGTTVSSGGKLFISGGNTASNTTLVSGGTVELNTSGAVLAGTLTFSGGNNALVFDKVLSAAAGDQAVITGFTSTDKIIVSGGGTSPTLSVTSAAGSNEVVATITSGTVTDAFTLSGAQYTAADVAWVSAGGGIYDLTTTYVSAVTPPANSTTSVTTSTAPGAYTETSGNTLLVLNGGSVSAATIDSGAFLVVSGGADTGATVSAGGTETVSAGSASQDLIYGTVSTISGSAGVFTNETVESGGTFNLLNGNTATGTTVLSGGTFILSGNNGAVTSTVLSGGGKLELDSPKANISGSLTFEGGNNTLDVAVVASSGFGDLAVISGFSSTDKIDVSLFGAAATLSFASSGGNEDVTVSGAGASETFIFSGTTAYTSSTVGLVSSGVSEFIEYSTSGFSSSPSSGVTTSVTTSTAPGTYTETSGNTLLVLSGGSVSAATIDNGAFLIVNHGADTGATISSGGIEFVSAGSASQDLIYGTVSTISGSAGVFTNETVESGGTFNLLNGNTATGTTVLNGGTFILSGNNGAVTSTVMSGGGTLELDSPKANISGSLTFEGGNNTLDIAVVASSGFGDLATISGFSSTDKIDVSLFGSAATLSFASSGGNEDVTVSGTGGTETFIFSGTTTYTSSTLGVVSSGGKEFIEYSTSGFSSSPNVTSVTTSTPSGAYTETSGNTLLVLSGGSITGATIESGGHLIVSGGIDSAATILAGATEAVSLGAASGDQIFGSATVSGVNVTGESVQSGGQLTLGDGATATNTVLSGGGLLDLASPTAALSGTLGFTGGGNTLEVTAIASGGYGDQAVISGFSSSDKIDVTGISRAGATLSFASNGSGGEIVTISGSGGSESFDFSNASTYNSGTMSIISDGNGGTELVLDTTPAVTFTSLSGLSTNQASYIVHGTVNTALDPESVGSTVSVYEGNVVVGTGTVGSNGYWSADVTFTNDSGTNVLTASDTDAAGQTGTTSTPLTYAVSTTAAAFTAGNLVISISGDGDGSGSYGDNQASPITLEQITTTGAIVSQLVLPQTTTVVNGITENAISGEYGSSSEGALELSADGHSLVIAGYGINADTYNAGGAAVYGNAALAQTTSIPGGQFTAVARVIADINAVGTVDTSTALYNVFNTQNPRSVATVNGSSFYISGQGVKGSTNQGVFYAVDGASSATIINDATDTRTAEIYNGQLYVSADSTQGGGTTNISNYGNLPTSATSPTVLTGLSNSIVLTSATANNVNAADIGLPVNLSPESYFFANADTLYVADGGAPKEGGLGDGGLQKWVFANNTWSLEYTLSAGLNLIANTDTASSGDTGLIGLTGEVVGNSVELFATTEPLNDLGQTAVVSITDSLSSTTGAGESFTTILTASAGENIRGISFAPTAYSPVISGTVAGQKTGVQVSDKPFAGVTITDPNTGTTDTVTITITGGGTLSGTGLTATATPGVYTLAATSAQNATAELDALVYTPAATGSRSATTVSFALTDTTSAATSVTDSATTLTIDPGPLAGTVASSVKSGASINLTSQILAAATPGMTGDTLTISADNTSGTLGSLTLVNGQLVYSATTSALSNIPANGTQADSFSYTITDQYGDTASGTVKITVTNPADVINGGPYGSSTIQGTAGADIINANGYYNTIYDNGGNDVVNAGSGNATVYVGAGSVVANLQGYFDTVSGGDGNDTVSGSAGNATVTLGNGTDSVSTGGYTNVISLGNGNDTVNAGQGSAIVSLGGGNDSVTINGYSNKVTAGNGNDTVSGGQGLETISLGNGNNTVSTTGYSNTITVGSGTNVITAGSGLDTVTAGAGTDTITLSGNSNSVTLNGSTASVSGGQGNDSVVVNGGNDKLSFSGWNSQATLNGNTTASISDLGDALRLNIGSSTQTDTITGFGSSDSYGVVDLKNGAGGYTSVASIVAALHSDGHGGTMLSLGANGSIDFANTSLSQLHASNFAIG